ncbi:MAG: hypothetical protein DRN88_01800 [Candidatus Hydrothermarchaeota archaeon]|nr:MAG: hypothetical protein DRN88_01800 [Candidatus Hydrothermarchaeota archaeon]
MNNILEKTFESMVDGIAIMDSNYTIVKANSSLANLLGKTKEQLIGEKCYKAIHEKEEPVKECVFKKIKKSKKSESFELYEPRLKKYFSIVQSPILDEKGEIEYVISVIRDITESKKYAEEIRKTKELWENTFNSMRDGVALINVNCDIIRANKSLGELLGKKPEEIEGEKCYKLLHNTDKPIKECLLKKTLKTKKSEDLEYYAKHLDKYISIRESPVFDDKGRLEMVSHVVRDITKRKRAEEELRKYAEELKKSNEFKEIFLDILRHDLLNPVCIIKGMAKVALNEKSEEDIRREIKTIIKNAEKLEKIIEDAAFLGKLESRRELEFEEVNLNELIRKVIEDFSNSFSRKKMNVKLELPNREVIIQANSIIKEIFSNLISNAIKYSPEKSKITVGLKEKRNKKVLIYVKDEGIGVPDEYKRGIFERFKRVKKEGVKGSGLGLAIVKRLVELHNGRVWVEDNTPKGSIFYVELPKKAK